MYAKLFASLYQGTLRGRPNEILVFTNLLAHAGRDGTVDKHFRAIADETGLSVEEVKAAIIVLESPDEESRSPEADGARLLKIDGHRAWGWKIVNYAKYRAIRSEEDRAEQNRLAQQRWRNKSKPPSAESKPDKPKERERDKGYAEAVPPEDLPPPALSAKAPKVRRKAKTETDDEWIAGLEKMECFRLIPIRDELGLAQAWCAAHVRQCTRQFFNRWLLRSVEKTRTISTNGSAPKIYSTEKF